MSLEDREAWTDNNIDMLFSLADKEIIDPNAEKPITLLASILEIKDALNKAMNSLSEFLINTPGSDSLLLSERKKIIEECFEFKNGLNKEKEFFGQGTPIINFKDTYHLDAITENEIKGLVTLSKTEVERFSAKKGDVFLKY